MHKIILALCLLCLVSAPSFATPQDSPKDSAQSNNFQVIISATKWKVSSGESLSFIANYWRQRGYGTSASLIYDYNKLKSSTLYPGTILIIPFTSVPPYTVP
jgi:LysM repeat protein